MIISIDDDVTGKERRRIIRETQIEYFLKKGYSLSKTAKQMGYSDRGLRKYLAANPKFRKKMQLINPLVGKGSFPVGSAIISRVKKELKKLSNDEKITLYKDVQKLIKKNAIQNGEESL